ncbi:Na+-driven multidrug efflux pump [Prevotella sp. ne3005]|uniref:MATE family efflux transporter n=1 Tax=Prevotella sp. ne3005 TaxID=1761887 RepID=UPI0008C458F4|nr:MATE family efflux transporter [Prevotella sp. ne3005]SEN22925.1 Na+-driven multidrug efflux pump [Prevotella sp. ne3005]
MMRSEYVLKNMFGSFFLATVMSALMRQLGGFTDSIVVSNLVSPDALSVVRIWQPFASCMFIIIGMMSAGASFLSARGIGAQNYDKVNRVFNNHLYYVVFSTLLLIVLVLPFLDVVAGIITTDERLLPMLKPYIHADMFAIFIAAVCGVPISYIITNGNPRLITRRIIISQILNVIFDLLLCGVFDMGLAGASYASGLSNLLAFTSLAGYMRKNSKIFRLRRPEKICSIKQYRECFSIGLPMLISALLAPALAFTMNSLVIGKLGADGMYIFTIYFQINGICMLALSGSNTAISNIGGILLGEEDYDSFRMLIRRIFRLLTMVMVAVSLLIFLFPDMLARIYGAEDDLIAQCYTPFRLMSLAFLPNALSETLSVLYFVQGHQKLCRWIEIITNVGTIGIIVIMAIYTPSLIWYILPVTSWLLLLVIVAMAYVVHRMNPFYDWPTLEDSVPSNPAVTVSVPYTTEGVEAFLTQVRPFVEACELKDGMAADMALEELLYEIVETHEADTSKEDEAFDVRIIDKEKEFTVVVKSKGPLRNPIYKYADEELMDLDEKNLRGALLSRLCKNIEHKYMNGINCFYLNYSRNEA